MLQEHLDAVWRAALAASGDPAVAEAVTTAVLRAAQRDAAEAELVRRAVLAAVRRAAAPAFARMRRAEREAVALARIARCPVAEVAAALGIGDGAARRPCHGGPALGAPPPARERAANAAACRNRSFLRTLRTCALTVASLRNSRSAISPVRRPSATSPRISRSRALRDGQGCGPGTLGTELGRIPAAGRYAARRGLEHGLDELGAAACP